MMRKTLLTVLASVLLCGSGFAGPAKVPGPVEPPRGKTRYLGSHPLSVRPGAGYCYIDVPHVHDYQPDKPALYQQVGDSYVFSGDPVPFGYDGSKTVFYGHHPIPILVDPVVAGPHSPTFCFMKGPHYHDYPAPEAPGYKAQNNVNFYIGPIPPDAARARPQIEQTLDVEYRPYLAQRPKVEVTPPPEWPGVTWVAPPPPQVIVAPAANPSVVAVAPQPSVVVEAPRPSVVVGMPAPTVVVAPPQPAVVIGVPPPGVIMLHGPGPGPIHGPGWGHGPGRGPGWGHGPGHGPGWGRGPGHWKGGGGHWKH